MNIRHERGELARELYISDYPDSPRESALSVWDYHTEQGRLPAHLKHYVAMADAVLAAGYRRPRTITTQAELDVLPLRAVVCDAEDFVLAHEAQGLWFIAGDRDPYTVKLPATVLWEPAA